MSEISCYEVNEADAKLVAIEVGLVNQSTSTSVQYGRNISDFISVTRHSHCFSCG
ncbi:hypothetical protein MSG34_18510 [Vibrio sp. 1CM2L]|uniref:hypothetical protein n=1 Tax=Vibrio sp. 1CM2L TaxID=2929166 RepID=UPI0020BE9F31|nr:hypothetical protein [Vibrio sp. 1CM2L]MCK8078156.1 hypothetical protein [Vibrio sp. 1CM2L]